MRDRERRRGGGLAPARALRQPEEADRERRLESETRERVAEPLPHLSSGGLVSPGRTRNRRGKAGSRASKCPCELNRGN